MKCELASFVNIYIFGYLFAIIPGYAYTVQSRSKSLQRQLNARRRRRLLVASVPPGGLSRRWLAAKHRVASVASRQTPSAVGGCQTPSRHRTSNDVLKIEHGHTRQDSCTSLLTLRVIHVYFCYLYHYIIISL